MVRESAMMTLSIINIKQILTIDHEKSPLFIDYLIYEIGNLF